MPVPSVEVEGRHRDALALDVLPDVELGPVEQRVHAHVRAGLEVGLEVAPELRRLVVDVPVVLHVARREVALLGARALFVRAHADDHARVRRVVLVFHEMPERVVHAQARPLTREGVLERHRLEVAAALDAVAVAVGKGRLLVERLAVLADDEVQVPLERQAIAVLDHLRHLVGGVDVHQRDRHVAEERLARQPAAGRCCPCRWTRACRRCPASGRPRAGCGRSWPRGRRAGSRGRPQPLAVASAALPGILAARSCSPHSRCSGSSHHQRPARQSSPSATARVHGAQPMLGKPWSCSGL